MQRTRVSVLVGAHEREVRIDGPGIGADTPVHWCSTAKALTAVLVFRLADRGLIDPDAHLREWIDLPGRWSPTVRQLLTHHGGIVDPPGSFEPYPDQPGPDDHGSSPRHPIAALIAGETDAHRGPITVTHEPGTVMEYSDAGYCLIEHLVELVTGQDFATVAEQEIAAPLGLTTTAFWDGGSPWPGSHAPALGNAGRGPRRHYPGRAASGLWSSPHDLAVWAADLGRSLSGEDGVLLSAVQARDWTTDTAGTASGVFVFGAAGRPCVMTQGWGVGFQSQLRWYPAANGLAAVLIDRNPGVPQDESEVGRGVLDLVEARGWR